jgi:LCP family protein required for cell wall assembly
MIPLDYTSSPQKRRSKLRTAGWVLVAILVIYGAYYSAGHLGNATISVANRIAQSVSGGSEQSPEIIPIAKDPEYEMPSNDKTRLDILILGIRGKSDIENGGLLTDTILLFSLDTKSGRASLVSIPRDLTVRVTDERNEKINTAYAHYGLGGTKKLVSRIVGVAIDNIVVADFDAFLSVVDTLGGITLHLDKPFHEEQQWGFEFSLPAGENVLTGEQALYYARSRYGSSDFDRSRRQMQVLMAIKDKATALSFTNEPIKALELMTTVRKHIETDLDILDLSTIKDLLAQQDKLNLIKRYQLTTENVLYETKIDGIYQLLPRDNTLMHIKRFMQTILSDHPVLPTPAPASASPSTPSLTPTLSPRP